MSLEYRAYLSSRWKWSIKGVGGVASGVSFAVGAIIAVAIWIWPELTHHYLSERMNAFVSGLIPLIAGASVFIFRWAISPYFLFKSQTKQIATLQKTKEDELQETFYSIVEWIRQGHYPLYALQQHEVDEFDTNDLVRVCDLLVQYGHSHPFDSIQSTCPQSDWRSFLKWARGRGIKMYAVEDTQRELVRFLKERGGQPVTEMPSVKLSDKMSRATTHNKETTLDENAPRFVSLDPRLEYAELTKKLSISIGYKNVGKRAAKNFSARLLLWEESLNLQPMIKGIESANDAMPEVQMYLSVGLNFTAQEVNPFFVVMMLSYQDSPGFSPLDQKQFFYYKWYGIRQGVTNFTLSTASRQERDAINKRLASEFCPIEELATGIPLPPRCSLGG